MNVLSVMRAHRRFFPEENGISVIIVDSDCSRTGNSGGKAVDALGTPYKQSGYSFFGELKIPDTAWNLIDRYDSFDGNTGVADDAVRRAIIGIGYRIPGDTKLVLDYDNSDDQKSGGNNASLLKCTLEIHFKNFIPEMPL